MRTPKRLVTYVDMDGHAYAQTDNVAVTARHELELEDGRTVLLLNDRGWGSSGTWTQLSENEIRRNARMVVGPDEHLTDYPMKTWRNSIGLRCRRSHSGPEL